MRITHALPLIVIALPWGCFEMPVVHIDKTEGPVVEPDASDDGGMDPQAACRACMNAPDEPGPGCQTSSSACQQNPKCTALIECAFELKCLEGSKRAVLTCGLPCIARAGVLTPDDPTLAVASNVFQCVANGPCGDICFQSE